jgi:hypothetical protein
MERCNKNKLMRGGAIGFDYRRLMNRKNMRGGMIRFPGDVPSLKELAIRKLIQHYIDKAKHHLTRNGNTKKAFLETKEELKNFVIGQLRAEPELANTALVGKVVKLVNQEVDKEVRKISDFKDFKELESDEMMQRFEDRFGRRR